MSEKTFIADLHADFKKLSASDRKKKIRELVADSEDNRNFIKEFFPEFYGEAFPSIFAPNATGRGLQ